MWNTLTWQRLVTPDVASDIAALRRDSLRLFLVVTVIGYVSWHSISTALVPPTDGPRYWALFPIVIAGLIATYLLLQRGEALAVTCFLVSAVVSLTMASWLLESPAVTLLYPLVALTAVVLLHPLAGLAVCVAALSLLLFLRQTGPLAFLDGERLIETGVASLLAVVVAWALGRNLVIAVGWTLDSYDQALRNTKEAQSHRAELVRALKQLDNAYYRLQQANAALEMAWRAAESAERAKSEFVTNISHELRTPLNLIIGFSEIILISPENYGVPLPAAYRGDLNTIYRSAQHLLTLTNDVIDLARVGTERLVIAREPTHLGQVVGEACDIVREYVVAKGLWLRVEVPPDLPVLNIDRLRIRQVLLNLLTNAARFTGRGGITISVSPEGETALVKVADTGHGIAPEHLPRVFEEFYRADGNRSPRQTDLGGFGLGLPISKRLIERHGGQMGVESALGAGTTFWFTLPTATVDGTASGERWQPPRPAGISSAGERIVVLAGADRRITHFLQRHLRGYRVIAAPDLPRAASEAVEFRALAILADVDADDHDGCPDMPVPVFRLPLPHGERIALALGTSAYLVKPVLRTELHTAIERLGRPIRTILIVDDDPRFIRLLARMLHASAQHPRYDILTAHNGREALAQMGAMRPDLVLLDLVMPELGGREVLTALAATPDLADIPVIVISAYEQLEGQFPLRGPLSIAKPEGFQIEELLAAVEALLGALEPPRRYLRIGERESHDPDAATRSAQPPTTSSTSSRFYGVEGHSRECP